VRQGFLAAGHQRITAKLTAELAAGFNQVNGVAGSGEL
jgi:hypothetical protein